MPIELRRAYLAEIKSRYKNARRKEKSAILDEFCRVCNYTRKHAIEILNKSTKNIYNQRKGPKRKYDEALPALKELWGLMRGIC